ncbi:hypothetical protein [Gordonia namibiensis]|nr:hypothetical protein [Gordonia namibiensis]
MSARFTSTAVDHRTAGSPPLKAHYRDRTQFDGLHAVADYAALYTS